MVDKAVEYVELFASEVAIMAVVGGQQTSMESKPLLAEIVTDHLYEFEVDVVHIFGQLLHSFFLLEQQLGLGDVDLVSFSQVGHALLKF